MKITTLVMTSHAPTWIVMTILITGKLLVRILTVETQTANGIPVSGMEASSNYTPTAQRPLKPQDMLFYVHGIRHKIHVL